MLFRSFCRASAQFRLNVDACNSEPALSTSSNLLVVSRALPEQPLSATLFNQFLFNLADATFHPKLGDGMFKTLLSTRVIDAALPRLAATPDSPWWNGKRADTVKLAWDNSLAHLKATLGDDPGQWQWGKAHTLTHGHPLGSQKPLDLIVNVGPFPAPGTHEVPNNQSANIGPAPWPVTYGPSTRRLIDFADVPHALTIKDRKSVV